jgi:hypothetical protein
MQGRLTVFDPRTPVEKMLEVGADKMESSNPVLEVRMQTGFSRA